MPWCIVLGCTSGYDSNPEKVSFFRVPRDSCMRNKWQGAIRRRDVSLTTKHCLCEKHFLKSQIRWKNEIKDANGNVLGVSELKVPRLQPGTIPTVFQWTENPEDVATSVPQSPPQDLQVSCSSMPDEIANEPVHDNVTESVSSQSSYESPRPKLTIQSLVDCAIRLPTSWSKQEAICDGSRTVFFYTSACCTVKGSHTIKTMKEVLLTDNMQLKINVVGQSIDLHSIGVSGEPIGDVQQLENTLDKIASMKICSGCVVADSPQKAGSMVSYEDQVGVFRHKKCPLLLSNKNHCTFCLCLKKSIKRRQLRQKTLAKKKRIHIDVSPTKQKLLNDLRMKRKGALKSKARAKRILCKCRIELQVKQNEMEKMCHKKLADILEAEKVPTAQQQAMKEILEAARMKSSKGRRFSEHWLLLCILFHMRSPRGYRFVMDHNILPLPSVRTIRRYLSMIDTKCGFDPNFFNLFEKFLSEKTELQKHGALLLDEIGTRKSVSVNTTNLTYKGLVDMGEDGPKPQDLNDKADHGLVLMFQPFADTYTQPIGVFASSGSVHGEVIAQIVIKAILLLEKAGAKVHAVIGDGASTNRKFWTCVGGCGGRRTLKHYFDHPSVDNRKIFLFSDTPHLMKTIRNRIFSKSELQTDPNEPKIKWEHLNVMYEKDKILPGQMRVCPKLTFNHLHPSNSAKMRVRLATQVLSQSAANGLRFYKRFVPELHDCENTAAFCEWMNSMFDALNMRSPPGGLKPDSPEFAVITDSLTKLDAWEQKVDNGDLTAEMFLTRQTAEGLRVTLKSTLDLTCSLIQDFGYTEVETGRVNQDALERFFGCVRQVGGSNDHPTSSTFLQIYKMLSLFGILKPPATGNCSITAHESHEPLISLAELKMIYHNPDNSKSLLLTLKKKIDEAVKVDDWDFVDHFEHDYSLPEVIDCVMYCFTGHIAHQVSSLVKCKICNNALVNPVTHSNQPAAMLANSVGDHATFVHPNVNLYNFIRSLEKLFVKHCNSPYVFQEILDDAVQLELFTFPCATHMYDIIPRIVQLYMQTRMRQYCKTSNSDMKKMNQQIKKNAKFYVT